MVFFDLNFVILYTLQVVLIGTWCSVPIIIFFFWGVVFVCFHTLVGNGAICAWLESTKKALQEALPVKCPQFFTGISLQICNNL
jgi:hypothetical protein